MFDKIEGNLANMGLFFFDKLYNFLNSFYFPTAQNGDGEGRFESRVSKEGTGRLGGTAGDGGSCP